MTFRTPLSLALLLTNACIVGEPGSGVAATETLDLAPFSAVDLRNQLDLEIDEGDAISGEVTCDDNLLDNLRIEVQNDALIIATRSGMPIAPRVRCVISVTGIDVREITASGSGDVDAADFASLDVVRLSGSGDVAVGGTGSTDLLIDASSSGDCRIDGIDADVVTARLSGSGGVTVDGTADTLILDMSSSGDCDAGGLSAVDVDVDISGSGDATVRASGTVSGQLSGSGDLTVNGDATVNVSTSGSGDVR